MAIVKVMLKTHHQRKDGTYPVVIYAYEVKAQYIYTGYHVRPDQFKDGRVIKHPDAAIINARVEDRRAEIAKAVIPGVGYIEGATVDHRQGNFCDYIRRRAKQFKADHKIDMYHKCMRIAYEITDFHKRDIYFGELTLAWAREYYTACRLQGNSQNTAMRKVKNIRTMYNQAVAEGLAPLPNPLTAFKVTTTPVNKEKLTADEIARIEALVLEPDRFIYHARNAFLFSFYSQGMRFENVCLTRREHIQDGHLQYQMNKGKKWRSVAIHPKLQAIIDLYIGDSGPYLFPFFPNEIKGAVDLRNKKGSVNAMINEHLKVIAQLANIKKSISFHMARHSFAFMAKTRGVKTDTIKDALGHTDTKITEAYLRALDDSYINEAVSVVWE